MGRVRGLRGGAGAIVGRDRGPLGASGGQGTLNHAPAAHAYIHLYMCMYMCACALLRSIDIRQATMAGALTLARARHNARPYLIIRGKCAHSQERDREHYVTCAHTRKLICICMNDVVHTCRAFTPVRD